MLVLRFFRRKLVLILSLAALVLFLKYNYPDLGKRIGGYISGLCSEHTRQAFSTMIGRLPEDGLETVEVFYEQTFKNRS